MVPSEKANLSQEVLHLARSHLGPATERFVWRQMNDQFRDPESITEKDIEKLAEWAKISIPLLTDDTKKVDLFVARLIQLQNRN